MSEPHPSVLALVSFLEHDVLPAIVLDTDYNILAANAAYRRQFGQDQQAPLGQKCHKVSHHYHVPCDQAGEDCPMRKAWSSKVPERVLHVHHTPRGPEHVDVELRPILDEQGRVIAFVERLTPIVIASAQPQEQGLVGQAPAFTAALASLQRAAPADIPVLLQGESGTGKELFARALHMGSPKADGPLVVVDCTSLTEALFESELFGYEKGAFTGAHQRKTGLAEAAHGGTLFLDEIGDMPLPMQVKLLRVLQERTFERVGSNNTQSIDVRIIAATHKNLENMIEAGTFREDLYYRLNVFPIEMAPLRERVEDIPLLMNELISRMEHEKRGSIRFNSASIMSLCRHGWPGNVRELANLVERMAIMHPYGVIGVSELPKKFRYIDDEDEQMVDNLRSDLEERIAINGHAPSFSNPAMLPPEGLDLKDYLGSLEQGLIQQALDDANGIVARAAERLRIRRTTLVEKMRKYGMSRQGGEDQAEE
ncbi:MAG TPA: sigma-54-dependent Fis family transcriptional regulator [Pseudomonas sp.]|nr:sigma-54-dependent Fis family transcriptional regulator [Pseudomonas sp.]